MNHQHPLFQAGMAAGLAANLAQLQQNGPDPRPPGSAVPGIPGNVPQSGMPVQNGQNVPPGLLVQYYSDLASGVIVPEDMRVEDIEFRVQIDPQGTIVFQTPAVMLVSRYQFALRRIMGFMLDPALAGLAPGLVSFNLQEQGRNFTVFKRPVPMASLVHPGSNTEAAWDGVYISVPGTQMECIWVVDAARWAALVGATKEFGIQMMGDYVACTPENT